MPSSVRTCIGCRGARSVSDLVRLVLSDGRVVVSVASGRTGRGASIHPLLDCVAAACRSGAFDRAFRSRVVPPDPTALLKELESRAGLTSKRLSTSEMDSQ